MMEQLRMINRMGRIPTYTICDGYTIRMYQQGDVEAWVDICKCGLLQPHEGVEAWDAYMLCFKELVPERDVYFVCDPKGKPVATSTAFVLENGEALLHMLAAKPEARGHKLGWSMTAFALNKLDREMPKENRILRLKTDDWRMSAVRAYLMTGYQPVLFDVDMDKRWQKICDDLNYHGVEMLDLDGNPTGIML